MRKNLRRRRKKREGTTVVRSDVPSVPKHRPLTRFAGALPEGEPWQASPSGGGGGEADGEGVSRPEISSISPISREAKRLPYDNPSVTLRVPPPFTQGRLWVICNHTVTNNPCRGRRPRRPEISPSHPRRGSSPRGRALASLPQRGRWRRSRRRGRIPANIVHFADIAGGETPPLQRIISPVGEGLAPPANIIHFTDTAGGYRIRPYGK